MTREEPCTGPTGRPDARRGPGRTRTVPGIGALERSILVLDVLLIDAENEPPDPASGALVRLLLGDLDRHLTRLMDWPAHDLGLGDRLCRLETDLDGLMVRGDRLG